MPPEGPRDPTGDVVRNLFTVQQLGNGLAAETKQLTRALFDDLAAQIVRLDPTAPQREAFRRARLERLVGEVESLVGKSATEVRKLLRSRLAAVGVQQAEWAASGLQRWVGPSIDLKSGRLSRQFFNAILDANPFEGETLKGWVEDVQKPATVRRVRRALQLGMAEGETIDQMVRRVRGLSDGRGGFRGGILETTTREAEAIVRTGVNFIANRGHLATYQDNADVLAGLEFVATLDGRTTLICRSLDGEILDVNDPDPAKIPPRHYQCRSVLVPKIDWEGLGIDPPEDGTRASRSGQVPSSTTQEEWLRSQPAADQDEMLGPTRARLFREGKVGLKDLVTRDQRIVLVEELLARN